MAQSREIKNRIRSVESTKKITRTMELVSTSKMKKAQNRVLASRPYASKIRDILNALSQAGGGGAADHPLLREPKSPRRVAAFLITSNRGLCGAYNTNVMRLAQQFVHEQREQGVEVALHASGKKAIAFCRYRKIDLAKSYIDPSDLPRYEHAEEIGGGFIDEFGSGEIDRVVLIYTRFVSAGRLVPTVETLLPFAAAAESAGDDSSGPQGDVLFEPSAAEILGSLLPLMVKMRFFEVLLNAQASEHSARMIAMKTATDNAGELIKTLSRVYNRERQAQITQELAEIMGGVEALKG